MKLWLLRPIEKSGLWDPWYDKAFGFVVRAKTEEDARSFAQAEGGAETEWGRGRNPAWTSQEHSTCIELFPEGEEGVIIKDFAAA